MGRRQVGAITEFNGLVGQQAQIPTPMSRGGWAARECRPLRPLATIDFNGTTRPRLILQDRQTVPPIDPEGGYGHNIWPYFQCPLSDIGIFVGFIPYRYCFTD